MIVLVEVHVFVTDRVTCVRVGQVRRYVSRRWMRYAACRGLDPNLFVPDKPTKRPPRAVVECCPACPVRSACESYGRMTNSCGWWGGTLLHTARPPTALDEARNYLLAEIKRNTNRCLDEWPYATSHGHAVVFIDGVSTIARAVVATLVHGPKPDPSMSALHAPGENKLCINKRHIFWGKQPSPSRKLTPDDVREIRRLCASGLSQGIVGERFGVKSGAVGAIVARRNWAWVT